MCVCMYSGLCVSLYVFLSSVSVSVRVSLSVCDHAQVHIFEYLNEGSYTGVCGCVCFCVSVCVCMYVCG